MEQLGSLDEFREVCADPLIVWAAQNMGSHVQVWTHGSAMAAAVTGLAQRDRVAVFGAVSDIVTIVRTLLDGPGPRYRPIGDDETIRQLCRELPGLTPTPPFGWMTTRQPPTHAAGTAMLARDGDHAEIAALLDGALPDSLARPGLPGVARWWVQTDASGVAACAADAFSAPTVGLLAGVATAGRVRGRGLGRNVTETALGALVRDYGSAALMVDADNVAAQSLYHSVGMTYRPLRAAAPPPAPGQAYGVAAR